jgi:hypothetical protein
MGGEANSSVRMVMLLSQLLKIVLSRIHMRFAPGMSLDAMVPKAKSASR